MGMSDFYGAELDVGQAAQALFQSLTRQQGACRAV
jgi:hypothetical protein